MGDYLGYERAFKNAGISYTVEPGAYSRGHGDLKEVRFIVIHHTASANNDAAGINPVRDGVAGLEGPLAQLCLKRNGQPHLIAVGVCWHAYGEIDFRGVPAGNGNYYSIGIEGIDGGYNSWTPEQRREYPRVVAALLKDMGLPSNAWIFHRDYQPKSKIDPGGFTKDWFQAEVDKYYNGPSAPVKGDIAVKRDQSPWLGKKLIAEEEWVCPDKVGRFAPYENGSVYWTPATKACALSKEMLDKYATVGYEAGFLKYPITDVADSASGKGRYQIFQGGSMYWTEKNGTRIVTGAIGSKWAETNWEHGELGMPISDEIKLPDEKGVIQVFEGGHIYYSPDTGAHIIKGLIWDRFSKEDYEKYLGYPTTDEIGFPTRQGKFQIFQFGHIYWLDGRDKAFAVYSDFMDLYERMGYENGRLGFVISNKERVEGTENTWVQHFEGGTIQINRNTKETILFLDGEEILV